MIKTKKWFLLTVCVLCMCAALIALTFTAYADEGVTALAEEQNVILKSNGDALTQDDLALEWTYGTEEIISFTFRPQHGDTAYYTLSKNGQEQEKFAVRFIDDNAMLYEVSDGVIDTDTPFRVGSLNAYLKTLKAGQYTLSVEVPAGKAPDTHSHWWDGANDVACGIDYSAVTLSASMTVGAYEITEANLGASTSTDASVTVTYSIPNAEVDYTGEANNLPAVELKLKTGENSSLTLVEGEDYTLSSRTVVAGNAELTIKGMGGFTGEVTVPNAYKIVKGENSVSDVYVVRWKHGQYDRNVNLFTANAKWGTDDLYFAIATDAKGEKFVDGLDEIRLTDGVVSLQVEQLLNSLDAKKTYYVFAIVDGGANYFTAKGSTQFEVVEITNTWTTTPNIVSWEWSAFDENVNVINAVPAFGDSVKFGVYTKDGDNYTAVKFDGKDSFEMEKDNKGGAKLPQKVVSVLSNLDAGTYYLFASVVSTTDNYTSINETFNAGALVPFRVFQATNYWTQIPQLSNWSYGSYDAAVNVISAAAAQGSASIKYSIYKQTDEGIKLLNFNGTVTFAVSTNGEIPAVVSDGLKALGVGKYYLRATVEETNNYTGIQEAVADFSKLPSFEVIKAENHWTTAPAINTWAEGNYSNDNNLPDAAAYFGVARIVITDVNDAENVIYDTANNINKLAEAGVGAYLLTATVAGTDDYSGLTFDTIFQIFVPETLEVGIPWWLVLIIVVCSLGVLVFIFWLLHEKGTLQMLTGKMIVAMRTKATMAATIASVKATKVAEAAKESVKLAEELDRLEAEKFEAEQSDLDEGDEAILVERDEATGMATFVRYQRPFSVKLIQATDEAKEYYSNLKNELLSYKKVKSKLSKGYDAFNKGRSQLAKLVIRGKTLCLYLALNPDDYADSKYKVERSVSKKFAEVPCLFRIRNQRRLNYAAELIAQLCEKMEIAKGENHNIDYRPVYESTEALLEKGLIKKVVYTRKYDAFIKDNKGVSIVVKEDENHLKWQGEVAATESVAATEGAADEENPTEQTTAEIEAEATNEASASENKKDEGEE